MTLYMIGLGIGDEKDITFKGLETLKQCNKIYLETYTSKMQNSIKNLEEFYKIEIIPADRDLVEKHAEETILKDASECETAFLVIGDPFGATTHIDLRLRAKKKNIDVQVIHNTSIINAIGVTGLELYKFGKIASIPFENENIITPYELFKKNDENGMHTLFLFDLDPSNERYLQVKDAIKYLLDKGLNKERYCVGCAAIGSIEPEIIYAKAEELEKHNFQKIPQCLIIPSNMHFMEEEALETLWKKR